MKSPRKRSLFPKPLASVLEPLTSPLLKAHGLGGNKLMTEWERIVGPQLARRCAPQKLDFPRGKKSGGTLTLVAENGFALELHYLQPVIVERLSVYFGYSAVARIVVAPSFLAPRPERSAPQKKAALPASCLQSLEGIIDPELKVALTQWGETLTGKA